MYGAYKAMRNRCYNPNNPAYKNYGGRGIKVCDRWLERDGVGFKNFLEDMGERPDGCSLDRIDNDGNYCKSNCRWVDGVTQGRNKRCNIKVSFEGNCRLLKELCNEFNILPELVQHRISKGWSVEDAVKVPPSSRRKRLKLQFGIGVRDVVLKREFSYKRTNCCKQWNKFLEAFIDGKEDNENHLTYSKFLLDRNMVTEDMLDFL